MSENETKKFEASNESQVTSNEIAWWHWHRRVYNWVIHWADTRYGICALIILAVTEPICVPIPADVMVIGMCLSRPRKSLRFGLTCAVFSVLGGTIAFSLGILIGPDRVVNFFEHISFGPVELGHKAQQALRLYQRYDFWAIAVSALTPVPYMLFSWVGGMAEVSLTKFAAVSIIFRTMRFGGEAMLFYLFGRKARRLIEKYFNLATIIIIILLAVIAYAVKMLGRLFTG